MSVNGGAKWGADGNDKHQHHRLSDNEALFLHKRVDDCEKNVMQIRNDLSDLKGQQALLTSEFSLLNQHIGRMAEILEAWNNAKGFWSVMRFVSTATKTLMLVGGMAAAIWIFSQTGHWINFL